MTLPCGDVGILVKKGSLDEKLVRILREFNDPRSVRGAVTCIGDVGELLPRRDSENPRL